MKILTERGLRPVGRNEVWEKCCACGNLIPDEYRVCNSCVLERAENLLVAVEDKYCFISFEKESVVLALRAARRWEEEL